MNKEIVIIRPGTETDLAGILEIVNYSILNTTANYSYKEQSIDEQKSWFASKIKNNLPVLVAEIDGTIVGFGTYGLFREKIGYQYTVEHSVYVDPTMHSKGIGSKLLNQLISLSKKQGYHLMIGVIDAENSASIAFDEKFGFFKAGTIREVGYKFDRWLDVVYMQLILN